MPEIPFGRRPLFSISAKILHLAEAKRMLNKAGGHLSFADLALKESTESLSRLGEGYEEQIDEIKEIRDELYKLNQRITDLIRRIY